MRVAAFSIFFFFCSVSAELASAETIIQDSPSNYAIVVTGGHKSSSLAIGQFGVSNGYFGVQAANDSNVMVVNQQGYASSSLVQQQSSSTGSNNAYVNQVSSYNYSTLTQSGETNIAGVAQNSTVGHAPHLPSGSAAAISNGPTLQTQETPEGYLTLFTTDGVSLATLTSGGLTAIGGFGRQH